MADHHLKKNLLTAITIISLLTVPETIVCDCFAGEFHVHVANKLPDNSNPMTVRCQSKDDDIGYHTLDVNQEIQWHFCSNGWSTLFFCHFWWNNRQAVFDVYSQSISFDCDNTIPGQGARTCYWAAKNDGFYLAVGSDFDKRHGWQ